MAIFEQMEFGDPLSVRSKPSTCSIEENETALSTGDVSVQLEQCMVSSQEFSNDAFGKTTTILEILLDLVFV